MDDRGQSNSRSESQYIVGQYTQAILYGEKWWPGMRSPTK